jgi:hypothetical protein
VSAGDGPAHSPDLYRQVAPFALLLLLAAWLGNAVLVGLEGGVHGRYQARIAWLLPALTAPLLLLPGAPGRRATAASEDEESAGVPGGVADPRGRAGRWSRGRVGCQI